MCEMGLFELKGQGRNAYYIAGSELVLLNSRRKAEVYGVDEEMYGANVEMYGGGREMYGADGKMCKAEDLPKELKERVEKTGKRMTSKEMESLFEKPLLKSFNGKGWIILHHSRNDQAPQSKIYGKKEINYLSTYASQQKRLDSL